MPMAEYQHHILISAPCGAPALAKAILETDGRERRIFGLFTPQIGLSVNRVVVISHAPTDGGPDGLMAPGALGLELHEAWTADPRPTAEETFPEREGFFSHRWFDVAEADWPRFRELSVTAWDNFEGAHDTRVIGFWRSHTAPRPGLIRVWLMAWYKTLAAWEGSRWYLNSDRADAAQAYENFRARHEITVDTGVSLLRRAA
jgi:hypothetical protein